MPYRCPDHATPAQRTLYEAALHRMVETAGLSLDQVAGKDHRAALARAEAELAAYPTASDESRAFPDLDDRAAYLAGNLLTPGEWEEYVTWSQEYERKTRDAELDSHDDYHGDWGGHPVETP